VLTPLLLLLLLLLLLVHSPSHVWHGHHSNHSLQQAAWMASYGCGTYALRSVCSSCVATATRCRQLRLVQMVRCCYPAQTMAPHVCMHCAADCGCACLLSAAKACRTAGTFALLLQAAMPECLVWNSCHSCDSIMERAFVKQICHTPHINMRNFLQQGAHSFACVAHTLGANPPAALSARHISAVVSTAGLTRHTH
jgi:hypothetical protein